MKNISEILKELGITVPEDKTAELQKLVAENYKTVAEFDKKVGRLEAERDAFAGEDVLGKAGTNIAKHLELQGFIA